MAIIWKRSWLFSGALLSGSDWEGWTIARINGDGSLNAYFADIGTVSARLNNIL